MTTTLGEAVIRQPLMSGHCAVGGTGHERCQRNGGGQRANPQCIFQPCPCPCHYTNADDELEVFECGACGGEIVECGYWPLDADGDVRYAHVDGDGRVLGEECTRKAPVSRNIEPVEADCIRCGSEFTPSSAERICSGCIQAEEDETDDFSDLDDEDDFSDLDDL